MTAWYEHPEFLLYKAGVEAEAAELRKRVPRWIPCSERMPKWGVEVLVRGKNLGARAGYFNISGVWGCYGFPVGSDPDVTHWMPLPAAPSAEGEA